MRPVLLNSCARAATAAEARFRIDARIAPSRGARVIALDDGAATIVTRVARQTWAANTRFYTTAGPERLHPIGPDGSGHGGLSAIGPELDGVDVAVLVATSSAGAREAAAIGSACLARKIMTAGVALEPGEGSGETVAILRPYARVLLVTGDDDDVAAVLTALRA